MKLATSFYFYILLFCLHCAASCCCSGFSLAYREWGYSLDAAQASHCGGFSVEHRVYPDCSGFRSCGSPGSRAQACQFVVHGLSCSAVCGIFPDQESNPLSPSIGRQTLTTEPPGSPVLVYNRKLRLRESMRRSRGHCFLGGDRRHCYPQNMSGRFRSGHELGWAPAPLRTHA